MMTRRLLAPSTPRLLLPAAVSISTLHRHFARHLVGHQHADFVQQAAETVRAAVLLAHQRQLVLDQRVVDDVNDVGAHGCDLTWQVIDG